MDEREEAWEEIVDVTLGCDDVRAAHTGLDRGGDQKKARKRHENYCTFDLQRLNA